MCVQSLRMYINVCATVDVRNMNPRKLLWIHKKTQRFFLEIFS